MGLKNKVKNTVLLLDLYGGRSRPFILPFLYLSTFFNYWEINCTIFRWHEGEDGLLLDFINDEHITHVFINVIMGSVLALVEPLGKLIKTAYPNIEIWVGGTAVLYIGELLSASPYIDHVSIGNPRANFSAFVNELATKGFVFSEPKHPLSYPPLAVNRHLDVFVHKHAAGSGTIEAINIASSSGCHHRCSFCYLARATRWCQSPKELVADMTMLQEKHNVCYFEFSDDNFPSDFDRVKEIIRRVKDAKLDFSFFCLASIDVLSRGTLDTMVAGGLKKLFIGVDALQSDRIKQLNKNYGPDSVYQVIDIVRQYPIDLTLAVVLGSYGETRDQIQALYDWVNLIKPEICSFAFLTPYPHTNIYKQSIRRGFVPPNTLAGWAEISKFGNPKLLNPLIDVNEYLEWKQRFLDLGTREFRSGIGDSIRRVPKQKVIELPIGIGRYTNTYADPYQLKR